MRCEHAPTSEDLLAWVRHTTGFDIDAFRIPENVNLAPVGPEERRVVYKLPGKNVAVIFNRMTKDMRRVLPDSEDPGEWMQLVLGLDSGSTVRAAAKFMENGVGLNCFTQYDKLHRLIRDVKLSVESTDHINRALLQGCFLMSLSGKPFGSGGVWF